MKKITLFILLLMAFAALNQLIAQDMFYVYPIGDYVKLSKFTSNIQSSLSKYEGEYGGVSETYESGCTFYITSNGNTLDIKTICGGAPADEQWVCDTVYYNNVDVNNGNFTISDEGKNVTLPFVKLTYTDPNTHKTVYSEGILYGWMYLIKEK